MNTRAIFATAFLAAASLGQSLTHPEGLQPGDPYRILVVTDGKRDATSSDIATYNAFVQADADAVPELAALNTTWSAVASVPNTAAYDNTDTKYGLGVPIYRRDGVRVANDYRQLWGTDNGMSLLAMPNVTSSGALYAPPSLIWSGTNPEGDQDFLGALGEPVGFSGTSTPDRVNSEWIDFGAAPQSDERAMYGMSDVLYVPYPEYPRDLRPGDSFRILFVTDGARDGSSTDVADYDAFVTAEAEASSALADFVTDWRALVSTPSVSARVHTGTEGSGGVPIYRPDGVRIADDYAHLWSSSGSLHAAPRITPSGATTTSFYAWTGTSSIGSGLSPLGDPSGQSRVGRPSNTNGGFASSSFNPQTSLRPIYALSDVITLPRPRHPAGLQPGDQYRVLLVTDSVRDAASADIADYDAFVQDDVLQHPGLRLLTGEWQALASTPSTSAAAHTGTDTAGGVPIYRPDGFRIANDYGQLWNGGTSQLLAAPDISASGLAVAVRAWTGTDESGENLANVLPLGDASGSSGAGLPIKVNAEWVRSTTRLQIQLKPLYALSGVITVPGPESIGASCGSATLTGDTFPEVGGSFDCTISGVAMTSLAAVLFELAEPTSGIALPTPLFAAGCTLYLTNPVSLGVGLPPSEQFSLAIPNDANIAGYPFTLQGLTIDVVGGEITLTNAVTARVRY